MNVSSYSKNFIFNSQFRKFLGKADLCRCFSFGWT